MDSEALTAGPPLDSLEAACEAALFSVARPLTLAELARALEVDEPGARRAVEGLRDHLDRCGHGVQVAEVAGGYQLVSRARFFGVVRRAAGGVRRPVLSKAAIETLAIVAYRQPVSRADIEHLRGVNCEGPLGTLLERGLIEVAYRGDGPGRPVYYRTTRRFLEMFGLASLENLPPLDGPGAPAGMAGAPAAQTTEGHHGRGKQADGVP